MKLGLLPPRPEQLSRVLKARNYINSSQLPTPPASTNNRAAVHSWPMYFNDRIGDCAIAAPAHMQQMWSAADGGTEVKPTDAEVIAAYSAVSGYDPHTGANDNGCVMLDVLEYWTKHGIGPSKLDGYLAVDITKDTDLVEATYLFGAVDIAVQLPLAWKGASIWDAPSQWHRVGPWARGSWGGHAIPILDYDADHLYVCSWGQIIPMTWAAWHAYGAEAYACLDDLWWGTDGTAPNGFDLAHLKYDLAVLGGQTPPPLPTPPAPTPPPLPPGPGGEIDLGFAVMHIPAVAGDGVSFGQHKK